MDVQVADADIMPEAEQVEAGIQPLSDLKALPLANGLVTSIYYDFCRISAVYGMAVVEHLSSEV